MKYIVKAQGKVLDYKQTAYEINADSREEAENIARERFGKEYISADQEIRTSASGIRWNMLVAIIALSAAVLIALIGFRSGKNVIRPDLTSIMYAAGVYVILLFKVKGLKNLLNIKDWVTAFTSWESIAMAVLMILWIASFIQLMFSNVPVFKLFSFSMDMRMIALVLALIAYFGSGILSLICLALFFLLSRMSFATLASMLGTVKGFIYLGSSLIGILAYLSARPFLYELLMKMGNLFSDPLKK